MTSRTDLSRSPFSYPGAWISLSRAIGTFEVTPPSVVHLVTHRGGTAPVMRFSFEKNGVTVETVPELSPATLGWRHKTSTAGSPDQPALNRLIAEATFTDPTTILVRGFNVDLLLHPVEGCDLYPTSHGAVVVNFLRARRRYRIDVLEGKLHTTSTRTGRLAGPFRITGPTWLLRITEHASTDPTVSTGPSPADFDTTAEAAAAAFASWCHGVIPEGLTSETLAQAQSSITTATVDAAREAAHVLWTAIVDPEEQLTRRSIFMSKNWMMRVWSWDHCFTALAVARAHPELAWDQLWTIFDHQDSWGAIPDCVNGSAPLFTFSKPPIHGWAVLKLLELVPEPSRGNLAEIRDALARWTQWWLDHRVPSDGVLPAYLHGNDGGWDNSTPFDAGTPLESPDLTAYLSLQAEAIAELDRRLGHPEDAENWAAEASRLRETLLTRLHDGRAFSARVLGTLVPSQSLFYALPIVLGARLPQPIVDSLCATIESHLTGNGLATEHPDSPHYTDDGYWRGPMWAPAVHLIVEGLHDAGRHELAERVTSQFLSTCERNGFAENFDAMTGAPLRDPAYTWTAAVYLLLIRDRLQTT
ncbi:MAG: amylo-alpha-1,6-glucosidase [Actinomycetota bacterium]